MKYGLHFLAIAAIVAAVTYSLSHLVEKQPNIILISIDTLRADHLSCYGYHRSTPNIDAFAKDSVQFNFAYSQAPWTTASHMSLFTSLYPSVHRVTHARLSEVQSTLVADLQNYGYQTAGFVSATAMSGKFGFKRGFDEYYNKEDEPTAEVNNERVFEWLDLRDKSKPLFLFLHYYDVHRPYDPKPPYNTLYCRRCDPGIDTRIIGPYGKQTRLTFQEIYDIVGLYDGEVRYMDDQVKELLDHLKARNLYDNSIIILLSDHGEGFFEHGLMDHGNSLYQELMRVPLLIKFPHRENAGKKIDANVRIIDVMPTVFQYLKRKPAQFVQGVSLLPLLRMNATTSKPAFASGAVGSEMVSDGRWKLIHNNELEKRLESVPLALQSDFELYDLLNDPKEHNNLAGIETSVEQKLWDVLSSHRLLNERLSNRIHTEHKPLDAEIEDQLRSVGYIQ
jgi:arylsulfatase A-like enzyme